MMWFAGAYMAPFMEFVEAWRRLEPKLMGRIDSLGRGPNQLGTVEDFANLARVVDHVLRDLSRSVLPLPPHIANACAFARLWQRRDRLGRDVWGLAKIYARSFSDVAADQIACARETLLDATTETPRTGR